MSMLNPKTKLDSFVGIGLTIMKVAGPTILLVPCYFVLCSAILSRFRIHDPLVALFGSALLFLVTAPRLFNFLDN